MFNADADNLIRLLHDLKKAYRIGYDDGYRGRRRGAGDGRGQFDRVAMHNGPTYSVAATFEALRDQMTSVAGLVKSMGSDLTKPRNDLEKLVGLRKGGVVGGLKENPTTGDITKVPDRA